MLKSCLRSNEVSVPVPNCRPAATTNGPLIALVLSAVLSALALGFDSSNAIAGDRGPLQRACFAADALVHRPGEQQVRRTPGVGDGGPPAVEPPPAEPAPIGAIRRVELPPGRKLIALTFDFCEQPGEIAGYDGAIIDYLRTHRVKATLFMGGRWLTTHPERSAQLLADPLFEMASHGWAHRNLRQLGGAALNREIIGPSLAFESARQRLAGQACARTQPAALSGLQPRIALFRFPFGACNRPALEAVAAAGLVAVQWDVSTGDPWPGQSARAIADLIVRSARPGSIVLAHANGRGHNTAAALPLAIPRLRSMGYELVTVGELIAAGRPVRTDSCYDSRPGDTDKYDALAGSQPRRQGRADGSTTSTVPR